jgi:hypothetical protein
MPTLTMMNYTNCNNVTFGSSSNCLNARVQNNKNNMAYSANNTRAYSANTNSNLNDPCSNSNHSNLNNRGKTSAIQTTLARPTTTTTTTGRPTTSSI